MDAPTLSTEHEGWTLSARRIASDVLDVLHVRHGSREHVADVVYLAALDLLSGEPDRFVEITHHTTPGTAERITARFRGDAFRQDLTDTADKRLVASV